MFLNIFIGLIMVGITVSIQAYGSRFWLNSIASTFFILPYDQLQKKTIKLLITTGFLLLLINSIQAFLWAILYYFLPGITVLETFDEAAYFSLITFTTLGYGDITLGPEHRILSGFEAINGILLIGWSSTLMFSSIQQIFKKRFKNEHSN